MIEFFLRLLEHSERRPALGYVASGFFAVMGFLGGEMAKAAPPDTLLQMPAFVRFCGYVTAAGSAGICICTLIIQVSRVRRAVQGIPSDHPFEHKRRR